MHPVAYPRNYSVRLYLCGPMEWGWPLIGFLAGAGAVYVVGGAAWGKRTRGGGGGSLLSAHPHFSDWRELGALCTDGAAYARGQVTGGGGGGGSGGGADSTRLLASGSGGGKEDRRKSKKGGGSTRSSSNSGGGERRKG